MELKSKTHLLVKINQIKMESFENIKLSYNCPKKLNELEPCGGAWNCNGCQKMVYDFRGMTEAEILNVFMQSGKQLCGVYDAGRFATAPQKHQWHKWLSAALISLGIGALNNAARAQQAIIMGKTINRVAPKDTARRVLLGEVAIVNPEVPGGNAALERYLHQHIENQYKFTGRAIVAFTIDESGSIGNITIIKSANRQLDNRIIDALKHAPRFKVETKEKRAVKIKYTLPITFAKS